MIRLSLSALLAVCVATNCAAQDEKPPVTVLEGTWRESAAQFSITFAGDTVTITVGKQTFAGKFRTSSEVKLASIIITVDTVDGQPLNANTMHTGALWMEGGQLQLLIDLHPTSIPREQLRLEAKGDPGLPRVIVPQIQTEQSAWGNKLGLAPVTRSLEKVKK